MKMTMTMAMAVVVDDNDGQQPRLTMMMNFSILLV